MATRSNKLCAVVVGVTFLLAFVVSVLRAVEIERKGGDAYRVGDWLINYEGGFVRRGLVGQALLWEGRCFPGTLLPFVLIIQVALYGMFLIWGYKLIQPHLKVRASILLLALSPACFLFEALNPQGFRKELLGLFILATFCHALVGSRVRVDRWLWCLGLVLPLLILSHEALFVLVPYFVLAAWLYTSRSPLPARQFALRSRAAVWFLIGGCLLAFAVTVFAAGDKQKVHDILESLQGWSLGLP